MILLLHILYILLHILYIIIDDIINDNITHIDIYSLNKLVNYQRVIPLKLVLYQ